LFSENVTPEVFWHYEKERNCPMRGGADFFLNSWLAMNKITDKGQMQLMGQKDPKMTMRYYV